MGFNKYKNRLWIFQLRFYLYAVTHFMRDLALQYEKLTFLLNKVVPITQLHFVLFINNVISIVEMKSGVESFW